MFVVLVNWLQWIILVNNLQKKKGGEMTPCERWPKYIILRDEILNILFRYYCKRSVTVLLILVILSHLLDQLLKE